MGVRFAENSGAYMWNASLVTDNFSGQKPHLKLKPFLTKHQDHWTIPAWRSTLHCRYRI